MPELDEPGPAPVPAPAPVADLAGTAGLAAAPGFAPGIPAAAPVLSSCRYVDATNFATITISRFLTLGSLNERSSIETTRSWASLTGVLPSVGAALGRTSRCTSDAINRLIWKNVPVISTSTGTLINWPRVSSFFRCHLVTSTPASVTLRLSVSKNAGNSDSEGSTF